ncbi:hypothetical protein MIND_01126600 [Mycena indigotica]|uniref:Uncharacterized protein n=1 Tax=Mycena indigotica TaxID=2126181 RepID=A0A8H6S820_9AGAR|nr:uncharacterized protein MIND_01126600 [Mycena indigotica]KAF7293487.1 hypothetical protein MIND_01126600 [Mycena indigotica]
MLRSKCVELPIDAESESLTRGTPRSRDHTCAELQSQFAAATLVGGKTDYKTMKTDSGVKDTYMEAFFDRMFAISTKPANLSHFSDRPPAETKSAFDIRISAIDFKFTRKPTLAQFVHPFTAMNYPNTPSQHNTWSMASSPTPTLYAASAAGSDITIDNLPTPTNFADALANSFDISIRTIAGTFTPWFAAERTVVANDLRTRFKGLQIAERVYAYHEDIKSVLQEAIMALGQNTSLTNEQKASPLAALYPLSSLRGYLYILYEVNSTRESSVCSAFPTRPAYNKKPSSTMGEMFDAGEYRILTDSPDLVVKCAKFQTGHKLKDISNPELDAENRPQGNWRIRTGSLRARSFRCSICMGSLGKENLHALRIKISTTSSQQYLITPLRHQPHRQRQWCTQTSCRLERTTVTLTNLFKKGAAKPSRPSAMSMEMRQKQQEMKAVFGKRALAGSAIAGPSNVVTSVREALLLNQKRKQAKKRSRKDPQCPMQRTQIFQTRSLVIPRRRDTGPSQSIAVLPLFSFCLYRRAPAHFHLLSVVQLVG